MPPVSPPIVETENVESCLSEVSAVANKDINNFVVYYGVQFNILNYHVHCTGS